MRLQLLLPLLLLLSCQFIETEAWGIGFLIRVFTRLFRLAAEMARRGNSIPYRQITSQTQTLIRSGRPGVTEAVKKGLTRVKDVVLSPKFQAGLLVAEGAGAIIEASVEANMPEISYANMTDAELEKEWEVSIEFLFKMCFS